MNEKGFSILELLITLAIMGVVMSIAVLNLRPFSNPLEDAWVQTESFLKLVRAKAMATTSAYRIRQDGQRLVAEYAERCSAPSFTQDPSLVTELPAGVRLTTGSGNPLQFCFSSRGYANSNTVLLLSKDGRERRLEILLGGGVRRL
jgi:prepilin-type N-terminal cleavage/methylation domain-containing protein